MNENTEQKQPREGFTRVDGDGHEHTWRTIRHGVECEHCGITFFG